MACDKCRAYWRSDRGFKMCPKCGGSLVPRDLSEETPPVPESGTSGGALPMGLGDVAAEAMKGMDSGMMKEVMSKMDMGAFANAIGAFAETFKSMEGKVGEILVRTDTLLHNQSLIYSLLQRVHEDLLATRPLPIERMTERVKAEKRKGK